jgi:hypothetical protein
VYPGQKREKEKEKETEREREEKYSAEQMGIHL